MSFMDEEKNGRKDNAWLREAINQVLESYVFPVMFRNSIKCAQVPQVDECEKNC